MQLTLNMRYKAPLKTSLLLTIGISALWSSSCSNDSDADAQSDEQAIYEDGSLPDVISYNDHIRPILNQNCTECHGGVKAAGGVSFLFRELAIVKGEESKRWAIVPGKPEESELIRRITDGDDPMPPAKHGHMLPERETALLKKWIQQGAKWETHWSYIAPKPAEIPAHAKGAWAETAIDSFVLRKLNAEGLSPNKPADSQRLRRRIALDLTGLPASKEIQSIENLEDYVDALLATKSYGERWASMWMDLARYADSKGYEKDSHRDMWPYRDYLINSFNKDKPYNEFILEQIAGDMLPDSSMEQLIATAFHRNTQTNEEGGTDDEEFRVAAVIDRVNTTWEVFQGTTMGCVQCHSHPYDPFRHEEYYMSLAYFNNTEDTDDNDYPTLKVSQNATENDRVRKAHSAWIEAQEKETAPYISLADKTSWKKVAYTSHETTGSGKLKLADDALTVTGTVPSLARFNVRFKPSIPELGALRIDALPNGDGEGKANSGFSLSFLELWAHANDGKKRKIKLTHAVSDFTRRDSNAMQALQNNGGGWHIYPKQFHKHWLIVVPAAGETLADGEELELIIQHKKHDVTARTVLRKFKLSMGAAKPWQTLMASSAQKALVQQVAIAGRGRNQKGANLPIMIERPASVVRNAHIFEGGNWMTLGKKVEAGVPGTLPEIEGQSRLHFAKWLGDKKNPLTARVMVNRLWSELLGRGFVPSLGDFGTQSDRPSHPELLDYLSLRYMNEYGWKMKPLLKEIVMSKTYQQSSLCSPEIRERDPYNKLLARGPRSRLSAEMIRDQALSAAGLLSRKMYGPSVMPHQPNGVWQTVYSGAKWVTAKGEDNHRRALYTYWKRTSPYPSMLTFDAPSREVCSIQRIPTNTPLQALVKLNDPVYFEAAKAFGKQMADSKKPIKKRIAEVYTALTATEANEATLTELGKLYQQSLTDYKMDPALSKKVGATPEMAAFTIVSNVLLNLDETLTK